ncbi:olfactory receptor 4K3-like protein [Cricetulus griseus]|nr:olfactory receptor 4K3-like protein [Cricetulus griseus]
MVDYNDGFLLGKFSSIILLNMFSVPLSWISSSSSIPIILRFGLFMGFSHVLFEVLYHFHEDVFTVILFCFICIVMFSGWRQDCNQGLGSVRVFQILLPISDPVIYKETLSIMDRRNQSTVSEFVLLGLSHSKDLQVLLFIIFLMFYLLIVSGNIVIMVLIATDRNLHSPMYFFLANLSFVDMWLSSVTTPKMIADVLRKNKTISFAGCMSQVFFAHCIGAGEMVLLVVMAYDRYVAICKPLHYFTVMNLKRCTGLVLTSWTIGFVHAMSQLVAVLRLPLCGPMEIDSFFCDIPLVINLACMDSHDLDTLVNVDCGVVIVTCFILLLISYTYILFTVRQSSNSGASKALSTCTAHITVVMIFFVPCIFIYVWPLKITWLDKFLAVFYSVFAPLLNPAIYTLRNKEMRNSMKRFKSYFMNNKVVSKDNVRKMDEGNQTMASEFVLLGLTHSQNLQLLLFVMFLILYVLTVSGNSIVMFLITTDRNLHSPMYFFLANLSFVDMWLSSVTTPKMITDFLREPKIISFEGCMCQVFFDHCVGAVEMMMLVVMAYDRYVAICKPLHYFTIMNLKRCTGLVLASWTISFVHAMSQLLAVVKLPLCGHMEIDSFFCDIPLIIKLSCTDSHDLDIYMNANCGAVVVTCFILLLISYTYILITVRQSSKAGASKALSTCSAHITVVMIFFVPCIFIYVWPLNIIWLDKFLAVFYTLIAPLLNPVIYTLRNKEMKNAIKKLKGYFTNHKGST